MTASKPFAHRVRIGRITLKRAVSSRKLVEFNDTLHRLRMSLRRSPVQHTER